MLPALPDNSHKNFTRSSAFIALCSALFIAGLCDTIYYANSMGEVMPMPGGWTMCMMWMGMPGDTWFSSATGFLLMWLAMMVAMMMPSALPGFLRTKRQWRSLCYIAAGYFAVWLTAGLLAYTAGMVINKAAMHSEVLSDSMPLISGTTLMLAAAIQFTQFKMKHLMRCRSTYGCAITQYENKNDFVLGCRQGISCCACCSSLMIIQLVFGIMNPLVMIITTIIITAEKLVVKPLIITRFAGVAAFAAGLFIIFQWMHFIS